MEEEIYLGAWRQRSKISSPLSLLCFGFLEEMGGKSEDQVVYIAQELVKDQILVWHLAKS